MRYVNIVLMLLLTPVVAVGYIARMVAIGFEAGWLWAKAHNDEALDRHDAWTAKVDPHSDINTL